MTPLVSICIPTYNGAQFIAEALDSVIDQTYSNLEIIVSDDASTDKTLSVVEGYQVKTNIPIYIHNHQPCGIGANWNHCIKQAQGEYIKFLFQDDVLLPTCVEKMVNVFDEQTDLGMVACKRQIIYNKNYDPDFVSSWLSRFKDLQEDLELNYIEGVSFLDKTFFKKRQFYRSPMNKIGEPTCLMFKKELLEQIGYFREDLKQILDYEFSYRVLKSNKIAILEESLIKFRLHEFQATNLNKHIQDDIENEGYSKILYKEYLSYVDAYTKIHLLKKHNFFYKIYYKIIKK